MSPFKQRINDNLFSLRRVRGESLAMLENLTKHSIYLYGLEQTIIMLNKVAGYSLTGKVENLLAPAVQALDVSGELRKNMSMEDLLLLQSKPGYIYVTMAAIRILEDLAPKLE